MQSETKQSGQKPPRPNKDEIKGLPPHSQFQWRDGTWYVYFPYCFRENGARKQERDYIGTLSEDGLEFKPNLYFVQNKPVFENRPPERWKNETMRRRAYEKQRNKEAEKALIPGAEFDPVIVPGSEFSVGASALAVAILCRSGMAAHVAEILNGNLAETIRCLNLAVKSVILSGETNLPAAHSDDQKYIGTGCPKTSEAIELFRHIGLRLESSSTITRAFASQHESFEIVMIDGIGGNTCTDNISTDAPNTHSCQESDYPHNAISLLLDVHSGDVVLSRAYISKANAEDGLEHLQRLRADFGFNANKPLLLINSDCLEPKDFCELERSGLTFLVRTESPEGLPNKACNSTCKNFYDQRHYVRNQGCYAVKSDVSMTDADGTVYLHSYVFRSPGKEMARMDELLDSLDVFSKTWLSNAADQNLSDSFLLRFFKKPMPGKSLEVDQEVLSAECRKLGFFGLVGNADVTLDEALDRYRRIDEIDSMVKQLSRYLKTIVPAQSGISSEGLLMTAVAGVSILIFLQTQMDEHLLKVMSSNAVMESGINRLQMIQKVLKDLSHIRLAFSEAGKPRLLNVSVWDKDAVAALGFPGLFDSADKIAELLSAKNLAASMMRS